MELLRSCRGIGAAGLGLALWGACTSEAAPGADAASVAADASTATPAIAPYDGCDPAGPEAQVIGEMAPPAEMTAGQRAQVSLSIANCGDATWEAAASTASSGVKLGSRAPDDNERWGVSRVALPGDVPPGYRVRVSFAVTAPETNGTHDYQFGLVDELVRWIDAPSELRRIAVTGGSEQPVADLHERGEWVSPEQPVDGPAMDLLALRYITIHYNGDTIDLDGSDDQYQDEDYAQVLRNMQSSYLASRGYSLGYNSGIAPDGDEWEIRGTSFRSAANGCREVNEPGYAIQLTLPTPDAVPTEAQLDGLRQAIARVRAEARAAGNDDFLELNGHRDVRPLCGNGGTSCPGDALYSLLEDGALEP